jgi:hypothetical protein
MSSYSTDTFKMDHLIRDSKGIPIGRVVLRNDSDYKKGEDLQVAILKIPLSFNIPVHGLEFYIDGVKYGIPSDLVSFRSGKRSEDYVMSNFKAKVIK